MKTSKYIICVLAVVALICGMTAPAYAAGVIYNPEDYIDNVSVSGNKKTVTYTFDDATAITDIYWNGSKIDSKSGTFYHSFSTVKDFGELLFSSYLLGVAGFPDTDAWSGVIDVSDIMPYADLKVTGAYHITISYDNTPPGDVVCQWRWGFLCYDADMHYVKTDYTPFTSTTLPGGAGAYGYVLDVTTSYTIPSNVAYIMPVVQSIWTVGDITYHNDIIDFYVNPYPFSMSCDIDMIYEQSNTMQAVKDELEKLNDKQSETNNKLDEIITGGESGDALGDASDNLDNENDKFDNTLDDYHGALDQIPTAPPDLNDVIDKDAISDAVDDASQVFDWDASGLTYMFVPMSISLSLAVLFYVIFGKD